MKRGKGILRRTTKSKINWGRPKFTDYGDFRETNTKGDYNGIVVLQNRFIRSMTDESQNDYSFKIVGRTGWITNYRKILGMLKVEDQERQRRRQELKEKGLLKK